MTQEIKILDRHVAYIEIDSSGTVKRVSEVAQNQLLDVSNGSQIKEYFPEIRLEEGLQKLETNNAVLLKDVLVDIVKVDENSFKVYFSANTTSNLHKHYNNMTFAKLASLGEMLSGLAHEIATPLTIIGALAHHIEMTVKRPPLNEQKLLEKAGRISKTVEKIGDIIKAIRKISRSEENDDQKFSAKVSELVNEVLVLTRFKITTKNVSLDVSPQELELECNYVQIMQVLINLINNASDALDESDNNDIKIKVYADQDNIVFEVKDNAGLLDQKLSHSIFDHNFTTKSVGKGTGIGLYLSKKIVKAHNGAITARLESGWTVFRFHIPKTSNNHTGRAA